MEILLISHQNTTQRNITEGLRSLGNSTTKPSNSTFQIAKTSCSTTKYPKQVLRAPTTLKSSRLKSNLYKNELINNCDFIMAANGLSYSKYNKM